MSPTGRLPERPLEDEQRGRPPKEMASASESICRPKALWVLVSRATRPSSMSKKSANTRRSDAR